MTTSNEPVYSFTPGGIIAVDDTAYQRGYDDGKADGIKTAQQSAYDKGYAAGVKSCQPDDSTVRDVSTLIGLGTFQGMNDAEVQKVIDYYVDKAHSDAQSNAYRSQAQSVVEQNQDTMAELADLTSNVLKSILESTTSYVAPKLETSTPTEV